MKGHIYLILDNIRSLHNVGSMFRTADAFDVSKIYLCGYTGKPLDKLGKPVKEITKTALGAEKTVPWEYVRHTWRVIEQLKKEGVTVVALENNVELPTEAKKIFDISSFTDAFVGSETPHRGQLSSAMDFLPSGARVKGTPTSPNPSSGRRGVQANLALIVGNEVGGISPQLLKRADAIVYIPMRGKKESLNVSVACGVALYALSHFH